MPARRPPFLLAAVLLVLLALTATPAAACTSFCFDTPEGPVVGANLDLRWSDGLIFVNRRGLEKASYMLNSERERLRWVARHGSVTFNLVGIEMPWGGMNEAGLTVSSMQLLATEYPPEDARYPVSSATWAQYVLDTCATVDEVIACQDSLRLKGDAVHFLVADAGGACAVIETLRGETIVYTGDNLPVRALANAMYHDCVHYLVSGDKPAFNPGRSAERVAGAFESTAQYDPDGGITASDWALEVLTEVVVDPKRWWKGMTGTPYTRWSVAYDLARRRIRFVTVDHEAVRSIDLARLDFDCEAPVLMLNVNAELEGPVEGALQPFDPQLNREFAWRFLERWGSDLDDDEMRWLTDFLEGFECASGESADAPRP